MAAKLYTIIEPDIDECSVSKELTKVEVHKNKTVHILLRDEELGEIDFKKTVEDLLKEHGDYEYPVVIHHLIEDYGFYRPKIESYGEDRISKT